MWIDSFLEYLRLERNYSEKTAVSYGIDLREFEGYFKKADAEIDFTTVDADVVRNWVMHLMDEGRAATSVNRKLSTLRSFYRFLLKKKVMAVNPMTKVVGPKKKKPLPSFVREKDMDRLLDDLTFGEGYEGCRDRMILEMFYATGMRLSELIGLDDADVDFSAKKGEVTCIIGSSGSGIEFQNSVVLIVFFGKECLDAHLLEFFLKRLQLLFRPKHIGIGFAHIDLHHLAAGIYRSFLQDQVYVRRGFRGNARPDLRRTGIRPRSALQMGRTV